jgi:hypothetical protein
MDLGSGVQGKFSDCFVFWGVVRNVKIGSQNLFFKATFQSRLVTPPARPYFLFLQKNKD